MIDRNKVLDLDSSVEERSERLLREHQERIYRETDNLFALIFAIQWLAAIILSSILSPRTWSGNHSAIHFHVWLAIFMGGALTVPTIALVRLHPGHVVNRYVISVSQMLWSTLLIQVTGGRIESHFHIFGSLAFLAFYRDWRLLVCASAVTAVDHYVRGVYWPLTIYGTLLSSPWRWLEHVAWVVFCDTFLIRSCYKSQREMWDIAGRGAAQARLIYQARHDVLTGLPNRFFLESWLEEALRNADDHNAKVALMFLDLDGFKEINDSMGHQAGDDILKMVGTRLSARARPSDFVVRLGGDEFALILTGILSAGDVPSIAARMLASMDGRFSLGALEVSVGASIGVCVYPDGAQNSQELQANADQAMYEVKASGKQGIRYFTKPPETKPGTAKPKIETPATPEPVLRGSVA